MPVIHHSEAEAGGSGYLCLHSKFKVSLGYIMRAGLKRKKRKKKYGLLFSKPKDNSSTSPALQTFLEAKKNPDISGLLEANPHFCSNDLSL